MELMLKNALAEPGSVGRAENPSANAAAIDIPFAT